MGIPLSLIQNPKLRAQIARQIGCQATQPMSGPVAPVMHLSKDVDGLNKTEAEWHRIIDARDDYSWIGVQCLTLKLADRCRYTPDFIAITGKGIVAFEVKGPFIREDAWVKLKVAARSYPWIRFVMAQKVKGGEWIEKEINT